MYIIDLSTALLKQYLVQYEVVSNELYRTSNYVGINPILSVKLAVIS